MRKPRNIFNEFFKYIFGQFRTINSFKVFKMVAVNNAIAAVTKIFVRILSMFHFTTGLKTIEQRYVGDGCWRRNIVVSQMSPKSCHQYIVSFNINFYYQHGKMLSIKLPPQ